MSDYSEEDFEVYNPLQKQIYELPMIYGYNAGKIDSSAYRGYLIAEDGTPLGGHICSSEDFMYGDLGILKGSRPDRHEKFQNHYPNGYRMEFVSHKHVNTHAGLRYALNPKIDGKMAKDGRRYFVLIKWKNKHAENWEILRWGNPIALSDCKESWINESGFAVRMDNCEFVEIYELDKVVQLARTL